MVVDDRHGQDELVRGVDRTANLVGGQGDLVRALCPPLTSIKRSLPSGSAGFDVVTDALGGAHVTGGAAQTRSASITAFMAMVSTACGLRHRRRRRGRRPPGPGAFR